MAKKEFHYENKDREFDFSVEYRMPTKQEFLSIAGLISLVSGICMLFSAFKKKDE
ncbi:MAG: hypothetical protein JJU01_07435 [Alkalibacterium sp.]|nr:hypothetical protein [Alkalibacterium sp.]